MAHPSDNMAFSFGRKRKEDNLRELYIAFDTEDFLDSSFSLMFFGAVCQFSLLNTLLRLSKTWFGFLASLRCCVLHLYHILYQIFLMGIAGCFAEDFQNFVLTVQDAFLNDYPAKSGILQSPSCVCLSVCLFVCLLAGFVKNDWSDFDEIW